MSKNTEKNSQQEFVLSKNILPKDLEQKNLEYLFRRLRQMRKENGGVISVEDVANLLNLSPEEIKDLVDRK